MTIQDEITNKITAKFWRGEYERDAIVCDWTIEQLIADPTIRHEAALEVEKERQVLSEC